MKWRVVFARSAEKELARISGGLQVRIAKAIRSLEDNPTPASVKRLKGREEFRLRVGNYRILYFLSYKIRTITISAIGHRREVYR
jgi:mRNA interferase RelE/StbE